MGFPVQDKGIHQDLLGCTKKVEEVDRNSHYPMKRPAVLQAKISKRPRKTFPSFSRKMRENILGGKELDDTHINMAQAILKEQFPYVNGLQDCLFGQKTNYFIPQKEDAIQILFVRNNHWCVSKSRDGIITLYDSNFNESKLH